MNVGAAKLLNQYQQVRSFYGGPVEKLGNERSKLERESHNTREQGDRFSSESRGLQLGQASTQILSRCWLEGRLPDLQKLASEVAAQASGNALASLALSTRSGLSSVLSGKEDEQGFAAEGAVILAGAMGNDPSKYAENLNQAIGREFGGQAAWFQGEVTPQSVADASVAIGERARQADQEAGQLYTQAQEQWSLVDNVQQQLNERFSSRRDPALFAQKKAAAQEFFAEFEAQAQQNPEIARELQTLGKEQGERFLSASGMLTSYRAQLTRHEGDVEKLDWRKLVGQFEATSFGR